MKFLPRGDDLRFPSLQASFHTVSQSPSIQRSIFICHFAGVPRFFLFFPALRGLTSIVLSLLHLSTARRAWVVVLAFHHPSRVTVTALFHHCLSGNTASNMHCSLVCLNNFLDVFFFLTLAGIFRQMLRWFSYKCLFPASCAFASFKYFSMIL